MKKLLIVVSLLSFAVCIMGYSMNYVYQEIRLENLDIRDYVTNTAPPNNHSANWKLEVTDGNETVSTDWAHVTYLRVCRQTQSPGNGAGFAVFRGDLFSTPGSMVGLTFTYKAFPQKSGEL